MTTRKAKAKANAGVLHSVQDDGVKRAKARQGKAKAKAKARAKANAGGSFTSFRMTA
jgi:hypothetical protein